MKVKFIAVLLTMSIIFTGCATNGIKATEESIETKVNDTTTHIEISQRPYKVDIKGELMANHPLNEAGEYGVGYKKLFVTDESQVFNAWGEKYGSKDHVELFSELNAYEPHTVVTQMWYPSAKVKEARADYLGEEPVASGEDVYMKDLYIQDAYLSSQIAISNYGRLQKTGGKLLNDVLSKGSEDEKLQMMMHLSHNILNRKLDAKKNAPIAEGKFPVVVMAHGLGGTGYMWTEAAEALASQGYIVVAPTFVSDGTMPEVFNNPESIVGQRSPEVVRSYYERMSHQGNVVENFFSYLYDVELSFGAHDLFSNMDVILAELEKSKAPLNGGIKATEMMGDLFDQRVKDVAAIIQDLKEMNQTGEFADKIDIENIGMTGHSLGSITTMIALEKIDEIKVGLGVNNGVPVKWEPDDVEASEITKPLFLLYGKEDDFLNLIFKGIWQRFYEPQGGDITKTYILEDERTIATDENTHPILTATYNRAEGPKIAVGVENVDHGTLVDDLFKYFPSTGEQDWKVITEKARMLSNDGTKYEVISDVMLEDGYILNQAGFIKDYYNKAWFGYYLKGEESYYEYLFTTPFEESIDLRYDNFE